MTDEDKARVLELTAELQELMPQLNSLLVTDDMFLLAPYDVVEATMTGLGIDVDESYGDVPLIEYDGDDSGSNGDGGMLQ